MFTYVSEKEVQIESSLLLDESKVSEEARESQDCSQSKYTGIITYAEHPVSEESSKLSEHYLTLKYGKPIKQSGISNCVRCCLAFLLQEPIEAFNEDKDIGQNINALIKGVSLYSTCLCLRRKGIDVLPLSADSVLNICRYLEPLTLLSIRQRSSNSEIIRMVVFMGYNSTLNLSWVMDPTLGEYRVLSDTDIISSAIIRKEKLAYMCKNMPSSALDSLFSILEKALSNHERNQNR